MPGIATPRLLNILVPHRTVNGECPRFEMAAIAQKHGEVRALPCHEVTRV